MDSRFSRFIKRQEPLIIALLILALIAIGLGIYKYLNLSKELASARNQIGELNQDLTGIREENGQLTQALYSEQQKNADFESQISDISKTVGTLTKLKSLDRELLQKYSKVYFLNENYTPSSLSDIDKDLTYNQDKELRIHSNVLPFLEEMIRSADTNGLSLEVLSAYRSFGEQAGLKESYKVTYGSGANQFSADQGYSEHQLGTTVDFTNSKIGDTFSGFDKSDEYKWLLDNAYKYGFIISYPKNNNYYQFEPWHWRFVGVKLATMLHNEGKYFYDLDQREIDPYLVNIFDNLP